MLAYANFLFICRQGHFIFYFMQRVICQGSRLPFFASLVATNSSLHFYVKFSRIERMGRYGQHKENSDHFESSVVVLDGV